jgi:hypothetical protein
MADRSTALTREQVNALTPSQVHSTLKRVMLVDGFDLVRFDLSFSGFLFLCAPHVTVGVIFLRCCFGK